MAASGWHSRGVELRRAAADGDLVAVEGELVRIEAGSADVAAGGSDDDDDDPLDIDEADQVLGFTALHRAALNGHAAVVERLLAAGADA